MLFWTLKFKETAENRRKFCNSHSDIKQIAHGSGFTAQAYFARVFRKRFGISPSQFRELPIQEQAHICETS